MMEKIYYKNDLIAVIMKNSEWLKGLNFLSQEKDFIQVGTWRYEKGKELLPHRHLEAKREVIITQEVIFVKKGELKADIYSPTEILVRSLKLAEGDFLISLQGGHGYQILQEDTEVLEIKNGPYVGPEKDRKRFEPKIK